MTAFPEVRLTSVAPNVARMLRIVGALVIVACGHGQEAGATTTAMSMETAPGLECQ